MLRSSSSSSSLSNQPNSVPINFSANHEKEALARGLGHKEQELKSVYAKIAQEPSFSIDSAATSLEQVKAFNRLFEEKQKAALQDLADITRTSNEIIELTKKQAVIHHVPPEEKLKVAMARRAHGIPLSQSEQAAFTKIEKALSNTSIIQAMPSQVIGYQLGILWQEKENRNLSESLYEHLAAIRIDQAPDRYQYIETDDMLLESTPLQIGELANNYLLHDEAYKDSTKKFAQCLRGIQYELLEKGYSGIHSQAILEVPIKWDILQNKTRETLDLPEVPTGKIGSAPEAENRTGQKNKSNNTDDATWPFLHFKRELIDPEKGDSEGNYKKPREIKIMEYFIPEHKKNQSTMDEVSPTNLWELMQATLSREIPKEVDSNVDRQFLVKIKKIGNKAYYTLEEKMDKKDFDVDAQYVLRDMKDKIEQYEKEKKEVKECHLKGKELIDAYFKYCDQCFEEEIKRLEREKENVSDLYKYGESRIADQQKRKKARKTELEKIKSKISELNNASDFWKGNKALRAFITEHQHEEILVYQSGLYVPVQKTEQAAAKDTGSGKLEQAMGLLNASGKKSSEFKDKTSSIVTASVLGSSQASLFLLPQQQTEEYKKPDTKTFRISAEN